jgi:ribosomal protein S18 acetylase RimI-like enzyme
MDRSTATAGSGSERGIEIRSATVDDAATVRTMVREMAAHQDQVAEVAGDVVRWAEVLARPEVTVLIAEGDGEAAGYVSAVRRLHLWSGGDVLALDDLYVREQFRDRGVGGRLMAALAAQADGLTIHWGVQPDNQAAIRFYRRLGATVREKVVCVWAPVAYRRPPAPGQ